MIIRNAVLEDIPEMQVLGKKIYYAMEYSKNGYETYYPLQFTRIIEAIITTQSGFVLLAFNNKYMAGIFVVLRYPALFGSSWRWSEIVWYADPELPKITQGKIMLALLKEAEKKINGWFTLATNSGKNIHSYLGRHGYRHAETTYIKEL